MEREAASWSERWRSGWSCSSKAKSATESGKFLYVRRIWIILCRTNPYVIFSDRPKIFFVCSLASQNPKTIIKKCRYVHMYVCLSHLFIYPKNLDHIMPYRLPSVIFSHCAKIFSVVLLASYNPKTTIKNVCLSVPSVLCVSNLLKSFRLFDCPLLPYSYGVFKRFPMGVFHQISQFWTPSPLLPKK